MRTTPAARLERIAARIPRQRQHRQRGAVVAAVARDDLLSPVTSRAILTAFSFASAPDRQKNVFSRPAA
jgi:hypothetical protein